MARSSLVHYIAPSAVSITPNCNGTPNDIAVVLARGAKIKVYSPNAGIGTADSSFQEWTIRGRNRRLADTAKPYTIYARLSKTDRTDAYLVFAPKRSAAGGWVDKYPYVTPQGLAYPDGYADPGNYWYVRMGTVTLPEQGLRSVTFDTGILGTDQFNTEWNMNPDQLNRIMLECTIDGKDAGPTPYVYWGKSLVMTATLNEGWDDQDTGPFDHWEIQRSSGDDAADRAWNTGSKAQAFVDTGTITLDHIKGGTDDFNATVAPTFKVTAWGRNTDQTYSVIATTSISILAETVEKYDLSLSAVIVSYNPQTKTYNPEGGVAVRIRATDQRGESFRITRTQYTAARLALAYAYQETSDWQQLPLDPEGVSDVACATIPASVFAAQKGVEVHLTDADGKELTSSNIAFVRDGEDSREREWIFLQSPVAITFGDAQSEHPKPSLIPLGEVSPQGTAQGVTSDKQQDDWVPEGWTDDAQGTDEEMLYEYGSYRDYVHSDPSDPESEGRWGDFTVPRIWSHYGEDAVVYDLIPSVSVINATYDGYITSDGIVIRAYRTDGRLRSDNILPEDDYPPVGDYYFAEYSVDGGEWTECSKFSSSKGTGYGMSPAAVAGVRESVVFRLKHTEDPDTVLKESLPVNVVKSMSDEEASERYLSKLHDDEAHGVIGFLKGLWVGIRDKWFWTEDGDISANNIETEGNVFVGRLLKAYNAYINKVNSTNYTGDGLLDTGWRITNEYEGGNSAATFDYLTIRKKAFFNELEIRKLSSIGGNFCLSPASGKIFRVEWFDGSGSLLGHDYYNVPWTVGGRLLGLISKSLAQRFLGKRKRLARRLTEDELQAMRRIRCYFYTDDGSTQTMLNWTVGAQARCQTFNIEEQMEHYSGGATDNDDVGFYDSDHRGEAYRTETDMYGGTEFYRGHKVSNTYWWRLVTAVGKAKLDDGKLHYFIEFMVNTGSDATHADYGSDLPSVGDQVVQMGHRTRTDQQNVIMFYTADEAAPAIKMYDGINSWNLNKRLVVQLSPKGCEFTASRFKFTTAYGLNSPTIIRGLWVNITPDANGNRRCYYNDVVSHNGSWWRCIVAEGTHKEDAQMTHWYTQEEIDHMSIEEQMELIDVPNYTVIEPGDGTYEQQAVWQLELGQQIAPYLVISPALFAVPCEKDGRATSAYSVSASVKLMVTNLEASITSVTMTGADVNVKLQGNYVTVNFAAGTAVPNKDYTITVEGTLNGQKYVATDKVSVYAVMRGDDAYEVTARPAQWIWNQTGANYSYEDIMRMIEEGTSPSDFPIEIDKVECLVDPETGQPTDVMGNSCTQISVVKGGVAQAFQITAVAVSNLQVTASYNNLTGRVWVTGVPNTIESGWVEVTVRYGNNVTSTIRIPFWCNLLGTWREVILGDTRAAIAEKTAYYDQKYNAFHAEYVQSSEAASQKFSKITGILGENGEKIVTQTEYGQYKQSASENFASLQRQVNGKLNTSDFEQTATSFSLCTTTYATNAATSAGNDAKQAAQGYANTAESNASSHADSVGNNIVQKLSQTGIKIDGNNREIDLIAGKVKFMKGDGTTANPYVEITDDGKIKATDGEFSGKIMANSGWIGNDASHSLSLASLSSSQIVANNMELVIQGDSGNTDSLNVSGRSYLRSLRLGVSTGIGNSVTSQGSFVIVAGGTITLPSDAPPGMTYFFKATTSDLTIKAPTGLQILKSEGGYVTSKNVGKNSVIFIYTGSVWVEFWCC